MSITKISKGSKTTRAQILSSNGKNKKISQHLIPDHNATGEHCVFKKNNENVIIKYMIFVPNEKNPNNFDPLIRFDREGPAHYNKIKMEYVDTPHIHDKNVPGNIRKPTPEEIPK